ncbi:hypothetical protein AB0H71_10270 [Nocardia sp. NPDC050697]|uniref:hypothetical protein n=1 Tax=Nocardia sp. NPDC050697 TaxID=3155158 RepID=UPI0033C77B88
MNLRRTAAAAALVIGALTVGAGTAYANPAPAADPAAPINYSVKLIDKTVVTTLKGGTFELTKETNGVDEVEYYNVKDGAGNVVMTLPVDFSLGDISVPVKPVVKEDGKVLELTPEAQPALPEEKANTVNVNVKPIASPIENQRAQNEFASQFGIATAVGSFLGTAVGAIAGGVTGCIMGLPLFGVGCIPAAIAGAGIGGPALAIAGIDLVNTIAAADGTTKWADKQKPADQPK